MARPMPTWALTLLAAALFIGGLLAIVFRKDLPDTPGRDQAFNAVLYGGMGLVIGLSILVLLGLERIGVLRRRDGR